MKVKKLQFKKLGGSQGFLIPANIDAEKLDGAPVLGEYYDLEINNVEEAQDGDRE